MSEARGTKNCEARFILWELFLNDYELKMSFVVLIQQYISLQLLLRTTNTSTLEITTAFFYFKWKSPQAYAFIHELRDVKVRTGCVPVDK